MTAVPSRTILVVDDELGLTGSLQQKGFLRNYEKLPYNFLFETCLRDGAYDARWALETVAQETEIELVLLDIRFGPEGAPLGFEILRKLVLRHPSLPVLVMSALDRDVDLLGRCLEDGAMGFLEKHRSSQYLQTAVEQAISLMQSHVLLGQSEPLRALRREAARLSPYDQIPVMIVGERGTGKERVARYIHHSGPRSQGAFVAVNCAGVPESLFEAEFFGAEKGAYTGATARRIGYIERAHGGTLFLDEVGTMPLAMQAKLLRVLQDRTFYRLGNDGTEIRSSFQLLSATNADPAELIRDGRLREDFLDRIAAVTIRTPALRECRSDIPLLAASFLERLVGQRKNIAAPAVRRLMSYDWPGNVRELQRVIQEALVRSEDAAHITVEHLPGRIRGALPAGARNDRADSAVLASTEDWARERLLAELRLAVAAKREIIGYKKGHWKAEFMRKVYPYSKAPSAKGFADLIKRLSKGPWGDPRIAEDAELRELMQDLQQ